MGDRRLAVPKRLARARGRYIAATAVLVVTAFVIAGPAFGYPVQQLPPGHVTIASVNTPKGSVVIGLHRIRYLGKVALCMSESNGGTSQSCANYPIGPRSNQNIGNSPVWWTTYIGVCTPHPFQVISGIVLRPHLTAWLHGPGGVVRMPTAKVPKAFGVAGGLIYALIASKHDSVTLRDANDNTVYAASVASPALPDVPCNSGSVAGFTTGASPHTIP
jgi:hypothetical protein